MKRRRLRIAHTFRSEMTGECSLPSFLVSPPVSAASDSGEESERESLVVSKSASGDGSGGINSNCQSFQHNLAFISNSAPTNSWLMESSPIKKTSPSSSSSKTSSKSSNSSSPHPSANDSPINNNNHRLLSSGESSRNSSSSISSSSSTEEEHSHSDSKVTVKKRKSPGPKSKKTTKKNFVPNSSNTNINNKCDLSLAAKSKSSATSNSHPTMILSDKGNNNGKNNSTTNGSPSIVDLMNESGIKKESAMDASETNESMSKNNNTNHDKDRGQDSGTESLIDVESNVCNNGSSASSELIASEKQQQQTSSPPVSSDTGLTSSLAMVASLVNSIPSTVNGTTVKSSSEEKGFKVERKSSPDHHNLMGSAMESSPSLLPMTSRLNSISKSPAVNTTGSSTLGSAITATSNSNIGSSSLTPADSIMSSFSHPFHPFNPHGNLTAKSPSTCSSIGHPLSMFTPPIPSQGSLPSTAPSGPPTPTIGSASGSAGNVVAPSSSAASSSCSSSASGVTNSSSPFISESVLQNQDLLRRELDTRFLASQDRNINVPPPPYMTRPVPGHPDSISLQQQQPHSTPASPFSSSMAPPPPHLLDKLSRLDPAFYGRIPGYPTLSPILTSTASSSTLPNLQHSSGSTSSSLSSASEGGLMLGPHPVNCAGSGSSSSSGSSKSSDRAAAAAGGGDSTLFGPPGHLAAFQPKSASINISANKCKSSPKSGRWCAMHVRIAWEIYHHQQKSPSLHHSSEPTSSPASSSSASLSQHTSHLKPSSSSSVPGSLVHSMPTSSVTGNKSSSHSVNSSSERSSDGILRPLNHNSLISHPFSASRASDLPFTTSLLSAAAGHAGSRSQIPAGFPGQPMDPFGPLASLNPYSRSPFGPFGNPFLAGLAPPGHPSSLLSHQSPSGIPTPPTQSSLLNDSWMRTMAGAPRPGSSSLLNYPGLPPPPPVMPPTSSSSLAAGSAWGGLRAEADRTDVRGASSSSDYMSPLHHQHSSSSSLEKRKEETKSSKSHSKHSKNYDGLHHTTSHDNSSPSLKHDKRMQGESVHRNGDIAGHHSSKNWDLNKSNKRERSPSSHNSSYSSPTKYPKYNSSGQDSANFSPFNPHSLNSHLSMMSNMTGSSAYGMQQQRHVVNNIDQNKSSHHCDSGSKPKSSSHRSSDDRDNELRRCSNDRPKSSSSSNPSGDPHTNSYLNNVEKKSSLPSSYREALEMELSKNPLLGFPPHHAPSPYSSSSALAAMSMASPLERARLMGMFGLHGLPGTGPVPSPFMHPSTAAALSSGYPGMDPMKSLWSSSGGSPFLPPLPGMSGLHPHLDPFKSLHEFPSRMPELLEREHILARYNILNSHGGGAPLTEKLKDSTSSTSSSSSAPGPSSSSISSSSGQHSSASSSLGSLGLPPPPVGLIPPIPPTAGLLPPPPLLPPLIPPPPSSLLGLPGSGSSSSSSLSMTPTLPIL